MHSQTDDIGINANRDGLPSWLITLYSDGERGITTQ